MTTIIQKPSRADVLERGFLDPVYFNRFFFERWFPDRVPWFHRGILAIATRSVNWLAKYGELDKIMRHFVWRDSNGAFNSMFKFDSSGQVLLEIATNSNFILPRGYSKTTLLNAHNIREAKYKRAPYTLYVSESASHSEDQLLTIRREFEQNEVLIEYLGTEQAERNEARRWTNDMLELTNGSIIRAVGRGGQIRGKQFRAQRPTRIICDDLEDEESVQSDMQRRKTRDWFYGALAPALPPRDRTAGIVMLGTLLAKDCLLTTIAEDPMFNTVILGALDRDNEPLWPEHESAQRLELLRDSAKRTGTLGSFYREKLSMIRIAEDAMFQEHFIIHEVLDPTKLVAIAIMCDPAISKKKNSDKCAFAVLGKHENGQTWVLDSYGKVGMTPREQVDKFFELRNRWKPTPCGVRYNGVETQAYQAALAFLLREEMAKRNDYFELSEIHHSSHVRKKERIEGILQPRYGARMMRHAERFAGLEGDLLDYPNGKLDEIDAIAMGVALLEPQSSVGVSGLADEAADEYDPLSESFFGAV